MKIIGEESIKNLEWLNYQCMKALETQNETIENETIQNECIINFEWKLELWKVLNPKNEENYIN
jgi:hypothetical protein